MRPYKFLPIIICSFAMFAVGCSQKQYSNSSVENDDMYFASTDRQKVLYEVAGKSKSAPVSSNSSDKDVNPEYVNSYAQKSREAVESDQNGDYDEGYYDESVANNNNYNSYSSNNSSWEYSTPVYSANYGPYGRWAYQNPYAYSYAPMYDPFWGPSFYSPRSTFWISFGFGSSWGHPYNNWYGGYDPFWGNYGYNPYRYNPYNYNNGFLDGYYYGRNNNYYNRPYARESVRYANRGTRVSRGASYSNNFNGSNSRSNRIGRTANRSNVNTGSNMRTNSGSDYSRGSRTSGRNSSTSTGREATTGRESVSPSITERSERNTTDRNTYTPNRTERATGSDNFNSRPSRPAVAPRTRGGYSDDSNRSNDNSRSNRSFESSSPSRSSGSEIRTSSPSRSSGSEYRAPSPSRSSGSDSSPSRSSGSSSSGSGSRSGGSSTSGNSRSSGRR